MKARQFGICILLALPATAAMAQPSIIAPSRSIDWSGAGVTGGIPNRTRVCATLAPGVTADDITAAIAACPAGQVVRLTAGTFNLTTGIRFDGKNNVTLRGAGANRTLLKFAATDPCMGQGGDICVNGTDLTYYIGDPLHVADWTAGYAQGTTQIVLSDTTDLSPGMLIVLDQLNDWSDSGGVIVCSVPGVCADEGPGDAGRENREQEQFVRVVSVKGSTVTITPGLHMPNWRSSQQPQAFWGNPGSIVSGAGVEDLSVDHTAATDGKSGIYFIFAVNSWVKGVRSVNANRNHVWLYESAHITVRDSYFYGTQNAASESYGIEEYMASDNLIENNILHHIAVPLQTNSGSGSVFGYNYSFDDFYYVPTWMQASSYLHGAGTDMVLHEGNEGTGFDGDDVHGSHNFVTAFRNYYIGWEDGKDQQTNPVKLYAFNRYMNFVGNVLGKPGYHNQYQWSVAGPGEDTSIYALGSDTLNVPADPRVAQTLMRWGNYDTVTGTARFVASEVPSNLTAFANPVPKNRDLPQSLYLQHKPEDWWGSVRWPAIGPDVKDGLGPGEHVHRIPAHICYDSTPKVNGILNFNAANCYPFHGKDAKDDEKGPKGDDEKGPKDDGKGPKGGE